LGGKNFQREDVQKKGMFIQQIKEKSRKKVSKGDYSGFSSDRGGEERVTKSSMQGLKKKAGPS